MARANNNGGQWWVAQSGYSVGLLERLFLEERAPSLLYEVVGGIIGHPTLVDEGYLYIQLSRTGWDVDTSLEDVRVSLMKNNQVTTLEMLFTA